MDALIRRLKDVENPRAALLGFGLSGRAVLCWLESAIRPLLPRLTVTVRDKDPAAAQGVPSAPWIACVCGEGWLDGLCEDVLVRSPGVRPDLPPIEAAVSRGAVLTSEISLFCERCPARLFAVTGSDGKTTTATLAADMLGRATARTGAKTLLGGNIGRPLLPRVGELSPDDRVVLELSSFQLMDGAPATDAAAWIDVSDNHFDWHRSRGEYIAAKSRLLPGTARRVLSADDAVTGGYIRAGDAVFSVSLPAAGLRAKRGAVETLTVEDGVIVRCDTDGAATPLLSAGELRVKGRYFLADALAAAALVWPFVTPDDIRATLRSFRGVPHRMEPVGRSGDVLCFDSSVDTTPARTEATLAALRETFDGPLTVLCGGAGKGVSFVPLARALRRRADRAVLTGACAGEIAAAMEALPGFSAGEVPYLCADSFFDAVKLARQITPPGGALLLSPACTSFDRFHNYIERSEAFLDALKHLPYPFSPPAVRRADAEEDRG